MNRIIVGVIGIVGLMHLMLANAAQWQYGQGKDEMRGIITKYAELPSDNRLIFEDPYGPGVRMDIILRKTGASQDVILGLNKGQFGCLDDCSIKVKFDSGPIQTFGTSGSTDYDTKILFLDSPSRFVRELRKARKLIIEAEFYDEGRRQFLYTSEKLNWSR